MLAGHVFAAVLALAAPKTGETHVVQPGQSLWSIATEHGCTVSALRRANALDSDVIVVGRKLQIPRCKPRERTPPGSHLHVVKPGDTLTRIARKYRTTVKAIEARNRLRGSVIVVGQKLDVGRETRPPLRVVKGQSMGRPDRGTLAGGVLLPHDGAYFRRRPKWSYGAQHAVDHTRRAIVEVRRRYPKLHRLAIGDLSRRDGGRIPGHRSHQSGRDIDIGLYFRRVPASYPRDFVHATKGRLHVGATWALVYALYRASREPGGPERIFLDYKLQGRLYEHARKTGVSKRILGQIFQYPSGRWARDRLVKHEPKHGDHLHVRFRCPSGDRSCR